MAAVWTLTFAGSRVIDATEGKYDYTPPADEWNWQTVQLARSLGSIAKDLGKTGGGAVKLDLTFLVQRDQVGSILDRIKALQAIRGDAWLSVPFKPVVANCLLQAVSWAATAPCILPLSNAGQINGGIDAAVRGVKMQCSLSFLVLR